MVFFLRNEVFPNEYTSMGLSPLHARVFYLFLTLRNKFHEVHLNNIYMSANILHLSYNHQNYVKVKGVCKTGGRGIPREVLPNEFHYEKAVDWVR